MRLIFLLSVFLATTAIPSRAYAVAKAVTLGYNCYEKHRNSVKRSKDFVFKKSKRHKFRRAKRQGNWVDRGGFGKLSIFFLLALGFSLFFIPPLWLVLSLAGATIFFMLQGFVVGGENTRYCFTTLKIIGIAAAILVLINVWALLTGD